MVITPYCIPREYVEPGCTALKLVSTSQQHPSLHAPLACVAVAQASKICCMCVQDIILYNNGVKQDLEKGAGIEQVMEHWDMLQVNCAAYINSDLPGLPPNHSAVPSKPTR